MKMEWKMSRVGADVHQELNELAEELSKELGLRRLTKDDVVRFLLKAYKERSRTQ